ncbi:MAG: hypothetical protein CUN55_18195, partial [Phototrophicales bacterium]
LIFLLDLTPSEANELVVGPSLESENILQNEVGVYFVKTGVKNKLKMTHLKTQANILQPKKGCETWAPTIKSDLLPWEVDTSPYEVMGEYCADEFDAMTARNLMGIGNDVNNFNTPELSAIENAMLTSIRQSLVDSVYKTAWFSDTNFADGDASSTGYLYDVDLSAYDT